MEASRFRNFTGILKKYHLPDAKAFTEHINRRRALSENGGVMEEARLVPSEEVWHADLIADLENAESLKWQCIGCDAHVNPIAWDGKQQYKVAAHFRAPKGHLPGCSRDAVDKLLESGESRNIRSTSGIPDALPSRVTFSSVSSVLAREGESAEGAKYEYVSPDAAQRKLLTGGQHRRHARSIRRICEIYHGFPQLRNEPLEIEGCAGTTYKEIFYWLCTDDELAGLKEKVVVAGIRFKMMPDYRQSELKIELNVGIKEGGKTKPFRVVIDWREWRPRQRALFRNSFEEQRAPLMKKWVEAKNKGGKSPSALLHFIGEQDHTDPLTFRVNHPHKICLLSPA